ncbi:MAG: hypothetical protein PHW99_08905 [Rhodoferax sp.]|nr:hypothetical protein [Rhodoferax sp.]
MAAARMARDGSTELLPPEAVEAVGLTAEPDVAGYPSDGMGPF